MAVTLNANTSTGFIATSDTSGVLQLQTGGTAAVSIGTDQSFNFSATGQRITGDFSNATVANRVMFQSSTTNGNTLIGAIPNGTGQNARIQTFASSDPTNTATLSIESNSSISQAAITSGITGTGTYLPMTFYTGGSESLRLSATTKAVILAGGSTSANGTGITFPATQSASTDVNTLDDYEEGTWTPTVAGSTTAGTASYSIQNGRYTKIGRMVQVQFSLTWSGGTGSGELRVTGLPFLSDSSSEPVRASGFSSNLTLTANNVMYFTIVNNSTTMNIDQYPAGGGAATNVLYDAAASVGVSMCYIVA